MSNLDNIILQDKLHYHNEIASLIYKRRQQMLVHSYIYYELGESVIDDFTWQQWANELVVLQETHPQISSQVEDYDQFKHWDGSSGYYLIFNNRIKTIANFILK